MRGWGDRVIEASIKKLIIEIAWGIHPSFSLARRAVALAQRAGLPTPRLRRAGKAQSRMDD